MVGFELGSSEVGSDRSAKRATPTTHQKNIIYRAIRGQNKHQPYYNKCLDIVIKKVVRLKHHLKGKLLNF